MKRSAFRNLWLLVVILLLGTAWFLFQKAEEESARTERAETTYMQLRRDKNNMENLSTSLSELDSLTLDERNTTRLDILRHLDIETKDYDFALQSSQAQQVGGAKLYIRGFELKVSLSYGKAMQLIDKLHGNKKVVLHKYKLNRVSKNLGLFGDYVKVTINGSLYGLEKR